jgi:hypothetical protein
VKKIFTVMIAVALIMAACAVLPTPNVKASADEAAVLNDYTWYIASHAGTLALYAGDLVVVGEIQNVGSNIIQNVTVSGTAYDSNGQALAIAQGTAFTFETTHNQKAPFSIDFPPSASVTQNSNWTSSVASVSVSVLAVIDTSAKPYTDFNLPQGASGFDNEGVYTALGVIVNNGTETMGNVWVVTTFFNADGKVLSFNFTGYIVDPSAPMGPGMPARFLATPADPAAAPPSSITNFTYLIDSLPLGAPLPNSQPTATTSSSPPLSSSQVPLTPIIVVAVVVAVAVIALILLGNRKKTPTSQPPPTPPPPEPTLKWSI